MKEVKNPSQLSDNRAEDEEDDSFYPPAGAGDHEKVKKSNQPHTIKQKESIPKKKIISKKRERIKKQLKKQCNSLKYEEMKKEKEKQKRLFHFAEKKADEIIEKMKECYQLDLRFIQQKKLACRKLSYLQDLGQCLKNVYICKKFVQKNGLNWFIKWLEKINIDNTSVQPCLSLRKGVLQILFSMPIGPDNVSRTIDLQRSVARQKRSQIQVLKQLSNRIIWKWNQLIYQRS